MDFFVIFITYEVFLLLLIIINRSMDLFTKIHGILNNFSKINYTPVGAFLRLSSLPLTSYPFDYSSPPSFLSGRLDIVSFKFILRNVY
jgi:hypothetical protein